MARIIQLNSTVYNKISAGEVVERPFSVVKELVENSLDANASEITVSITNGGIESICVSDNGIGIDKEDLILAFMPHATSKLNSVENLFSIDTLGFRGEALASISAVSMVSMKSRQANSEHANYIEVVGGKISDISVTSGNIGTTITVKNLFFNTPARLKFLKKPAYEGEYITDFIERIILANPEVSFTYINNGKTIYQTGGNGNLKQALRTVYGEDISKNLIEISNKHNNYSIKGFISTPNYSKSNKTYQTFILNGRIVTNSSIQQAIMQAYQPYLMKRQYPVYCLNMLMPFDEVDVNVHPTKADVRFENTNNVFSFVYSSIKHVLNNTYLDIEQQQNSIEQQTETSMSQQTLVSDTDNSDQQLDLDKLFKNKTDSANDVIDLINERIEQEDKTRASDKQTNQNIDTDEVVLRQGVDMLKITEERMKQSSQIPSQEHCEVQQTMPIEPKPTQKSNESNQEQLNVLDCEYTLVGQLFGTYILLQFDDYCYVIDQHAARERYVYDQMTLAFNQKVATQTLLCPYIIKTNSKERIFLLENLDKLIQIGFEIEEFGTNCFRVFGIPLMLDGLIDVEKFFANLFSDLEKEPDMKNVLNVQERLATAACKASLKGNTTLSNEQIISFLKGFTNGIPLSCPHGRPCMYKLSKYDFEKLFRRVV